MQRPCALRESQGTTTMRFDFRSVDDVESFVTFRRSARRAHRRGARRARSRRQRALDISIGVLDGDHAGRTAAWTRSLGASAVCTASRRCSSARSRVGGELEIESGDLVGLQARVLVQPEEREKSAQRQATVRMRVPTSVMHRTRAMTRLRPTRRTRGG